MSPALRLLCACGVAVLLSACRPDPEDLIFIIGSVSDPATGHPLAGQQVLMERDKTDSCASGREAPFYPTPESSFTPLTEGVTDAEGRFLVEVMRFQVARTDGLPYCLRLRLPEEADGGTADIQFIIGSSDMEPPPLFRWSPPMEASRLDGMLAIPRPPLPLPITEPIDWSQPRQFEEGFAQRTYEWELLSADGLPVWREEATGDLRLPVEVQEDFNGVKASLQMLANTTISSGSFPLQSSDYYRSVQRSMQRPLENAGLIPVSRGARCWLGDQEWSPCPLTDGSLTLSSIVGPSDPQFPDQTHLVGEVRFELAAPTTLRTAVVRDLFYGGGPGSAAIIEGSPDGETWTELGRAAQGLGGAQVYPVYVDLGGTGWYRVIPLDPTAGAFSQIRLRADVDGVIYGMRELSLLE